MSDAAIADPRPYDLLIRQARLFADPQLAAAPQTETLWDIGMRDGKIAEIEPHLPGPATQEIDAQGNLASPPLVESHIHLDSVLTAGQPRWNQSGTLFEGIEIWGDRKQSLTHEDVKARALQALQLQASQGVLHVRSHVDVSEPKLIALQALLEVRAQVSRWMDLQLVAFPQDGLYGASQNEALLEEALKLGADVVGGIPHYELTREDGVRSVHRLFDLAEQYDRPLDFHCDEIDDPQSRFLEVVAACALRRGMGDRTTASHTTAFGSYDNGYATKLMGLLRRARINFIANPLINITLQGRGDSYPKRRGVTRVKELWQAGLNVSLGHDCIQDPWYSLGSGNPLDVAHMAAHVCQMTGQAELEACYAMVTRNGAKTLGIQDYGIYRGGPANLVLLAAPGPREALCQRAIATTVITRGHCLSQTTLPQQHWSPPVQAF
ncbi:MAG: cytosine deaminase [Synechococcales cyanobacterium RM1_1_8]|nr:cytosine deaminase [Synechococcales cyanobacterium RM1_1_8]